MKQASEKTDVMEIFDENWPAIEIFLKLTTQWEIAAMGAYTGLRYSSLEFLFKIYRIKNKVLEFERIRTMELAALELLNSRD